VLAVASVEQITLSRIIGYCLHKQQQWADELVEDRAREAALEAAGQAHSAEMAETWTDLGAVELELEHTEVAITYYARALALLEQIVGVNDVRLADSLGHLGEAELVARRPARAIPPLERALQLELAAHAPSLQLADVQFPLGKALWPSPRGRQLVEQARVAFASGGEPFAPYLDRVVGWQRAH
ncbi:MAG TPA: tetratricopeptide repeat protein, partial [Kofleriaceae bacterium]